MGEENPNAKDGGAGRKRRNVTIDATPTRVEVAEAAAAEAVAATVAEPARDAPTTAEATAAPGEAATAAGTAAPGDTTSGDTTSGNAAAGDAASEGTMAGEAVAEDAAKAATPADGGEAGREAAPGPTRSEPATEAAATVAPAVAKRPSVLAPTLAAGLIGGLVALGAGYGALVGGYLPAGGGQAEELARARAALAAMQARVDELAAQPRLAAKDIGVIGELPARVAALEKRPAEGGASEALGKAQAELAARVDALRAAFETRQAAMDEIGAEFAKLRDDLAARASAAGGQVAAQGQQVASSSQAAAEKALADLGKRLAALEARPPVDINAATEALRKAQDDVRQKLAALETETRGMADKLGAATTQKVNEAASALLGKVDQQVATVKQAIEGVSGKVGTLEKSAGVGLQARDQATLAVALGALKTAIDAGRPYASELATAKSLARDTLDLSALEASAAAGVTPGPVIIERFQPAARKILDAHEQARGGGGFLDRLWLNAQQIVRVRPTGEVAGDGVPERIARIEARLNAGDLAGAAAEWRKLPEESRKIGADWGAALEARVAAAAAIDAVNRAVLSTLAKPAG